MKSVILIRSNQIIGDSRVEKYLAFFKEKSISYKVIGWDRLNTGVSVDNASFYLRQVGYVVGGLKAAFNRLFWFRFVIRTLRKRSEKPQFIHACDLDTAFPAALYKALFNKKCYLIFDAFDWVSCDGAVKDSPYMKKVIVWMEKFALKYSNKLIICEEERKVQVPDCERYDYEVLPNIPMITDETEIHRDNPDCHFDNDLLTLSYVGYFGKARFLDELLRLAEERRINLLIAGYGEQSLEEKCHQLNGSSNFKYFGRVAYSQSLNIMYNSDIIYAMYCKVINNHYYAAPNKFYEPMALGKPVITTKGIIIGNRVEKMDFGYTIEESYDELVSLIESISKEEIMRKGANASKWWKGKYSTYTKDFLENKYLTWLV